jgi:hypothetical protein
MRRLGVVLACAGILAACASVPRFSQNLSPAHKVTRGMTTEQARAIMGAPALAVWLDGILEWRYCDSRPSTDEFVVVYFHDGQVIDKASYTILNPAPNISDERLVDCVDNMGSLYIDGRSPPRRVRDTRRAGSR